MKLKTLKQLEECMMYANSFFVDEILNGKYRLTSICQYHVKIITESDRNFCLWISNEIGHFKCYDSEKNSMLLDFKRGEQAILYKRFKAIWNDDKNSPEEIEKQRILYEELKKVFEKDEKVQSL